MGNSIRLRSSGSSERSAVRAMASSRDDENGSKALMSTPDRKKMFSKSNASLQDFYDGRPEVEAICAPSPDSAGITTSNGITTSKSNPSLDDYYQNQIDELTEEDGLEAPAPKQRSVVTIEQLQDALSNADKGILLPQELVSAVMKYTQPRKTTMIQGRKTAFALSVFNLMNAIMGSGMLSLPYILSKCGIAVFVGLMLVMAVVVDYSIHLLITSATISGQRSYEDLCEFAIGPWGRRVVCVAIVVQNTGAMTTYLKVVGDIMPNALDELGIHNIDRTVLMVVVTGVIVMPLTVLKSISWLGSVSGASIMIMLAFCVVVIARSSSTCDGGVTCGSGSVKAVDITMDTFLALPTMCFSYVCHTCLLPVFSELHEADAQGRRFRRDGRIMNVAHTAIFGATVMYMGAAIFGYLTFAQGTKKDLLDNYKEEMQDHLTAATSLTLCISFIFTVPLLNFPHRRSLEQLLFREKPFQWSRHVIIGLVSVSVVLIMAIEVPQITEIFGAVGSTSSVTLVFLLPAYSFLQVEEGPWTSSKKIPAAIMFVVGGFIGVVSLGAFIVDHVK